MENQVIYDFMQLEYCSPNTAKGWRVGAYFNEYTQDRIKSCYVDIIKTTANALLTVADNCNYTKYNINYLSYEGYNNGAWEYSWNSIPENSTQYAKFNFSLFTNSPYYIFNKKLIILTNYLFDGVNACNIVEGYPLENANPNDAIDFCPYNLTSTVPPLPHNQCAHTEPSSFSIETYSAVASTIALVGVVGLSVLGMVAYCRIGHNNGLPDDA